MLRFSSDFLLHYACTLTLVAVYFNSVCLFVPFVSVYICSVDAYAKCSRCINMFIAALRRIYNLRALLVKWSIMYFDDPEPTQLLNGYALHLRWKMWHSQKCHNILWMSKITEGAEKSGTVTHFESIRFIKYCHADKCLHHKNRADSQRPFSFWQWTSKWVTTISRLKNWCIHWSDLCSAKILHKKSHSIHFSRQLFRNITSITWALFVCLLDVFG